MSSFLSVISKLKEITEGLLFEQWMRVKRFFPGVRSPLFHKTRGVPAANIALRGQGIKTNSGFSNFGGQSGVSFTRSLSWALGRSFGGNVIFVIDQDDFAPGSFKPFQHRTASDEFEERFIGDHIPFEKIRGAIFIFDMSRMEQREWSQMPFPVVFPDRDTGAWTRVE